MKTLETLGMEEAQRLWHGSTVKGIESGTVYMVSHRQENNPWTLEKFHTPYTVWGTWQTRDQMVKELSACHMYRVCMW